MGRKGRLYEYKSLVFKYRVPDRYEVWFKNGWLKKTGATHASARVIEDQIGVKQLRPLDVCHSSDRRRDVRSAGTVQ